MQENQINNRMYEEDEIDLRELFKTLMKNKMKIISITLVITILAIIYAYMAPKVYEARTLIEIGNYKLNNNNNNNNNKAVLDNASQLSKKLNILFIDMFKNDKDRKAKISSISIPKGSKEFIEIKAESNSNELAIKEINTVVNYVREKHQKLLNDVKQRREIEISNIDTKINNIENREIPLLERKIKIKEQSLNDFNKQIRLIKKNLVKIQSSNPSLAALKLMEKRDLTSFVIKLNTSIMDMHDKEDTLATTTVNKLKEDKLLVQSLMSPHNYKNTEIVGKIMISDYPIKPKKKLIVIVAFVTGLILSIFLVFFLEFIRGFKEE